MHLRLNYTYTGKVPENKGLYFCIYIDPSGAPTFGLARSERNILTGKWEWNTEIGTAFGGAPPFCYMEVQGNPSDVIEELEEFGYVIMSTNLGSAEDRT